MAERTKREEYEILRTQLDGERSSFIPHWRDLSENFLPRRSRFYTADVNKGDRRNQKIIDSTGTLALRTLRSGMMGGVTNPARPWRQLTVDDPDLAEYGPVKLWLHRVNEIMAATDRRSNFYNSAPIVYGDIGCFSTAAMLMEEDFDSVYRTYVFPIGSYMIANNERLQVDTFIREFRMTVRQIVRKFVQKKDSGSIDWSNVSTVVKNAWDRSNYETWIDTCHVIRPNEEHNEKMISAKFKKFSSCYYEKGYAGSIAQTNYMSGEDSKKILRESGYDYFPVLAPRWEITGEDTYGTSCPGMEALGDTKQLQLMQKRKAQAIEKMVNPPMTAPTMLKNSKASIIAGDITYLDTREGQQGFRPAHEVNPRIIELVEDIRDIRENVRKAFYEDLFLMLAYSDRRDITAREIEERHEEKLVGLGPMLEQLNQDMLDPHTDISFNFHLNQGLLPPPPPELEGQRLKVVYVSILAQAQKLVGISSMDRFIGGVSNLVKTIGNPDVAKKVNYDQFIDRYAQRLGVDPDIVYSDEEVAEIREREAQAIQAQQRMEMIEQGASAAKNLSGADLEGDNALSRIVKQARAGAPAEKAA